MPLRVPAQHIKARRCPPLTPKPSLLDFRSIGFNRRNWKRGDPPNLPRNAVAAAPDVRQSPSSCTVHPAQPQWRRRRCDENKAGGTKNTEGFAAAATKSNDPGNQSFQILHRPPWEQPRRGRI
jgi:hypothetical protein